MLVVLQQLHADLLLRIEALGAETRRPRPDMPMVSAARLALTRASSARTAHLEGRVYPALLAAGANSAIIELRQTGRGRQAVSSDHISQWTTREIEANWAAYCAASQSMRAWMKERISLEQALLYPALTRQFGNE